MIVQSIRNIEKNVTDMVFTVASDDLGQAKKVVDKVADKLNAIAVLIEEDVAKVSIVGAGMLGNPGIAARMFGHSRRLRSTSTSSARPRSAFRASSRAPSSKRPSMPSTRNSSRQNKAQLP